MSETTDRKALNTLLKRLRREQGEMQAIATQRLRGTRAVRQKVREAMKTGAATVPTIAETAGVPTEEALWHITAMKKYGQAVESGMDGSYPTYWLVEEKEGST